MAKKTSKTKTNTKKNTKTKKQAQIEQKDEELKLWISIVIIAAITITAYFKYGVVGEFLNYTCRFFFGKMYSLMMLLMVVQIMFYLINNKNDLTKSHNPTALILLVIAVCTLSAYSATSKDLKGFEIFGMFMKHAGSLFTSEPAIPVGGGIIGAFFLSVSTLLVDWKGTILVVIVLFIIAALLLVKLEVYKHAFEVVKEYFATDDQYDDEYYEDEVLDQEVIQQTIDDVKPSKPLKKKKLQRIDVDTGEVFDEPVVEEVKPNQDLSIPRIAKVEPVVEEVVEPVVEKVEPSFGIKVDRDDVTSDVMSPLEREEVVSQGIDIITDHKKEMPKETIEPIKDTSSSIFMDIEELQDPTLEQDKPTKNYEQTPYISSVSPHGAPMMNGLNQEFIRPMHGVDSPNVNVAQPTTSVDNATMQMDQSALLEKQTTYPTNNNVDMRYMEPKTVIDKQPYGTPSTSSSFLANAPRVDEDEVIEHVQPVQNVQQLQPLQQASASMNQTHGSFVNNQPSLDQSVNTNQQLLDGLPDEQVVSDQFIKSEDPQIQMVQQNMQPQQKVEKPYVLPGINLLDPIPPKPEVDLNAEAAKEKGQLLINVLNNFGIEARLLDVHIGPSVTKFEIRPEAGVKVSKILNLTDDIKMQMAVRDIRIEAPIPGLNAVGVEIPNVESVPVKMRQLVGNIPDKDKEQPLVIVLGKDLMGRTITCRLDKMPHLLIAGATGSGKSVCMNSIITSILMRTNPEDVKLLLVDPKKVEFTPYQKVPHLIGPVINDPNQANNALKVIVKIMDERYDMFARAGVRNIQVYNKKVKQDNSPNKPKPMPYIVVIIDELADLMAVAGKDVEQSIQRITQLARAAGIHLIVATQRPSTDVITGIIKANIPSRIAFSVSSGIDSRTILDHTGAERLLGNGDMLYLPIGAPGAIRVQGVFVTDDEVMRITDFVSEQRIPKYDDSFVRLEGIEGNESTAVMGVDADPLYDEVKYYIADVQKASTSLLQRRFAIGYNRAARMIDMLEEQGLIGPANGSKPREVFVEKEDLLQEAEEDDGFF